MKYKLIYKTPVFIGDLIINAYLALKYLNKVNMRVNRSVVLRGFGNILYYFLLGCVFSPISSFYLKMY